MDFRHSIYKKDIQFFLVLIPFINVLNYYLTYTHISFSLRTVVTFCIDTLEGYLAWFLFRYIVIFLDGSISIVTHPVKRIVVQLLVTTIAGMLVIIGLTEAVNYCFGRKPVPRSFYTKDILIFLIWFFVVNAIYIGWYYYYLWKHAEALHQEKEAYLNRQQRLHTEGFTVSTGKQTRIVPYNRIAGFFIEGEYVFVGTLDAEKHILDSSLDKIEKTLPAEGFFRVNRQYLVHRQIISGYKKQDNGKLEVQFTASQRFFQTAQVSRTRSPEFKQWLKEQVGGIYATSQHKTTQNPL